MEKQYNIFLQKKLRSPKKWFTLVEIIIWLVVISIGILAIIWSIQYATKTMTLTRSQVVAINLAREWMEMMFNKRDTNWQMFPAKKDQCWLVNASDPNSTSCETAGWMTGGLRYPSTANNWLVTLKSTIFNVLDSNSWPFWNKWFSPQGSNYNELLGAKLCNQDWAWSAWNSAGVFEIISAMVEWVHPTDGTIATPVDKTTLIKEKFLSDKPFYPSPIARSSYISSPYWPGGSYLGDKNPNPIPEALYSSSNGGDPIPWYIKTLKITYSINGKTTTDSYGEYWWVLNPSDIRRDRTNCSKKYGEFYRYIYVDWLYDKITWNKITTCNKGTDTNCWTDAPKELRFCSIVDYALDNNRRRVQLCTAMTNFKE